MAPKCSRAVSATLMVIMMMVVVIYQQSYVVVADQNLAYDVDKFRIPCAVKCTAECILLPSISLRARCAASCMMRCRRRKPPPSGKAAACTLECANSSADKFFIEANNEFKTREDVAKMGSFVDACYDQCS